jgi:LysR family transcriptional regulator, nod-box dependent transcriptional activator
MSSADLRQVALLVALIDAQSLSLAAERLHMTPSAASQSLQRLRDVFGDELVVRQGPRYLPTPLGETVLPSFRDMAALWQHTSAGTAVFDPASSEASLSLVCDAVFAELDLAACYAAIVSAAPRVLLDVRTPDPVPGSFASLRSGAVDVVLTTFTPPGDAEDLHAERFADAEFTHCCLSVAHPRIGAGLTLAQYAAEQHVRAHPIERSGGSLTPIDQALVSLGHSPRRSSIVLSMPHLAAIVATTDRLTTVSRHQGAVLSRYAEGLRLLPLPPEVPRIAAPRYMVWHHRTHHSPAHRWLRDRLREFVYAEAGPGPPPGQA